MRLAFDAAAGVRATAHPNPWVGCTIAATDGSVAVGATAPPGGPHAEVVALRAAGTASRGATAYVTLEPCSHHGRTPPCVDALVDSGVSRVVVAVTDPDPRVSGQGIDRLRAAGIRVDVGLGAECVERQLTPYLHHRRTGRPYVVCKLAASMDGRTAAPDGTSQWITGPEARADAHRLRAESDAVLVGAGTVRADDPALDVRLADGPDPLRVVLGSAPTDARVHPCREMSGDLAAVLEELGGDGVVQLLVEGGATTAAAFHRAALVDRYVLYLAPMLFGGADGLGVFAGDGAPTLSAAWRGAIDHCEPVGADVRIELVPARRHPSED